MYRVFFILMLTISFLYSREFKLKSIDGDIYHIDIDSSTISIKEFPNKIIILDFFGANCNPCIKEFPEIEKFLDKYGDSVKIIAIQSSSSRDNKQMQKFAKKYSLSYPIINLKEATELILFVQNRLKWEGIIPYKLLYNRDGILSWKLHGAISSKKLSNLVDGL